MINISFQRICELSQDKGSTTTRALEENCDRRSDAKSILLEGSEASQRLQFARSLKTVLEDTEPNHHMGYKI